MDVRAALKVLEANGSEQTRKNYGRHGVRGAMFGVGPEVLRDLAEKFGVNHDVACALWNSGIHEARLLATMIADPALLTARDLELWSRALDNYVVSEALARLTAQVPNSRETIDQWINSQEEWLSTAGWTAMYMQVVGDGGVSAEQTRPAADLPRLLLRIEREIHSAPNRTRYAMNSALIGIGMRNDALERQAISAARRIGPVSVEHGLTDCKTPDAANYIPKARKYAAARQAKLPSRIPVALTPSAPKAAGAALKELVRAAAKPVAKSAPKRGVTKKTPTRR